MEYGILIAESLTGGHGVTTQIIGTVDSPAEARSMASGYAQNAADYDFVAPDRFVIIRRDSNGFYTKRETF